MHSLPGHVRSLPTRTTTGKQFACRGRSISASPEHDLLILWPTQSHMKAIISSGILSLITASLIGASSAQTPDKNDEQQQLLALVKEVQTQQAQITDNQAKIETKLADLAETIRVARLFAGK